MDEDFNIVYDKPGSDEEQQTWVSKAKCFFDKVKHNTTLLLVLLLGLVLLFMYRRPLTRDAAIQIQGDTPASFAPLFQA